MQGATMQPADMLLIVPYGIETQTKVINFHGLLLLIVPYGIETKWKEVALAAEEDF